MKILIKKQNLIFNQGVMGSSPIEITLNINGLWNFGSVSRFLFAYNLRRSKIGYDERHKSPFNCID